MDYGDGTSAMGTAAISAAKTFVAATK